MIKRDSSANNCQHFAIEMSIQLKIQLNRNTNELNYKCSEKIFISFLLKNKVFLD